MTAFVDQLRNVLDGDIAPRPWRRLSTDVVRDDGWIVAKVVDGGRPLDGIDTADLIAAAPELLSEALRRLDPGDTDIEVDVRTLRQWAKSLPVIEGELTRVLDAAEQAFGEPS